MLSTFRSKGTDKKRKSLKDTWCQNSWSFSVSFNVESDMTREIYIYDIIEERNVYSSSTAMAVLITTGFWDQYHIRPIFTLENSHAQTKKYCICSRLRSKVLECELMLPKYHMQASRIVKFYSKGRVKDNSNISTTWGDRDCFLPWLRDMVTAFSMPRPKRTWSPVNHLLACCSLSCYVQKH